MSNIIQKSSILLIPLFITMINFAFSGIDNEEGFVMLEDDKSFCSTNMSEVFKYDKEKLQKDIDRCDFDSEGVEAHRGEICNAYPCFYANDGRVFPTYTKDKNHPLKWLILKIVKKLGISMVHVHSTIYKDSSAEKGRLKWHADHFLLARDEALKGDQVSMNEVDFNTHLVFFVLKRTPLGTDSYLRIGSVPYDEGNCIPCGNSSIAIPDSEVKEVACIPDAEDAGYHICQNHFFTTKGEKRQWLHSRDPRTPGPTDEITKFKRETLVVRISTPKDNKVFFDVENKYLCPITNINDNEDELIALTEVAKIYGEKHQLDLEPIEKGLFFRTNGYEDTTSRKKWKLRDLLVERRNKMSVIDVDDGKLTPSCFDWLKNKFENISFYKPNDERYRRSVDSCISDAYSYDQSKAILQTGLNSDYKEKNEEEAEAISSTYKATLEKKKACLTEFKDKAEAKGPANIQQLLKKNLFNRT